MANRRHGVIRSGKAASSFRRGREKDCSRPKVKMPPSVAAFERTAAKMSIALQVPDHGFDCRATAQLALDDAEDAMRLPGTKTRRALAVGRRPSSRGMPALRT